MLSTADNELLCRVGPGTPGGNWLREYWVPLMRAPALKAGGDPERLRVFGENYVAFRAADGRIGIFDEACPHRGASLVLGRVEECGLRCIYHGWMIDVDGVVRETPNDPTMANPERIPVRKIPTREAGQMIWGWFGEGEPAAFPNFVFNQLPEGSHVRVSRGIWNANWVQVVENLMDPLHGPIMHGPANRVAWQDYPGHPSATRGSPIYASHNTPPIQNIPPTRIDFDRTDYGYRYMVFHPYTGNNDKVWLPVTMPGMVFTAGAGIGEGPDPDKTAILHTPVDDETTMVFIVSYNPARLLGHVGGSFVDGAPDLDNWVADDFNRDTQWKQDRAAMAERSSWSGIGLDKMPYGPFLEDVAVCESMGAIIDRRKEHLCAADVALVQARRVYLDAIRTHMAGGKALGVDYDVSHISLADGPEHDAPRGQKKVA